MIKTDYTRQELIEICEKSCVPQDKWGDRDSEGAQRQVGDCWALLRAGCDFKIVTDDPHLKPDENTIWLYTYSQGFNWFESCDDDRTDGEGLTEELHYLPTPKRIEAAAGEDWY